MILIWYLFFKWLNTFVADPVHSGALLSFHACAPLCFSKLEACHLPSTIANMLLLINNSYNPVNHRNYSFKSWTYLVEVDGLVPASCLHQKLVCQDAIVRAVPVAAVGDAAGLPVLVKSPLETCRKPPGITLCLSLNKMGITETLLIRAQEMLYIFNCRYGRKE